MPGEARCVQPAPASGLPCSSRHHGLGPGRQDFLEAALVEESTLPGPLQSCGQEAEARLSGQVDEDPGSTGEGGLLCGFSKDNLTLT